MGLCNELLNAALFQLTMLDVKQFITWVVACGS